MTSTRKKILILLLLSLIGIGVGYVFMYPLKFGLCNISYMVEDKIVGCISNAGLSFGQPMFHGLPYFTISLFLLLIFPYAVQLWKKFALLFIPISIVLVILTPVFGESFSPVPPRETLTIFLGKVYILVSIFLIFISWYKGRKMRF